METIREATAVAEPPPVELAREGSPSFAVPALAAESRERELALHIRMTALSLVGIALIGRDPDPEPSR
jgi:hypothetical protein